MLITLALDDDMGDNDNKNHRTTSLMTGSTSGECVDDGSDDDDNMGEK